MPVGMGWRGDHAHRGDRKCIPFHTSSVVFPERSTVSNRLRIYSILAALKVDTPNQKATARFIFVRWLKK